MSNLAQALAADAVVTVAQKHMTFKAFKKALPKVKQTIINAVDNGKLEGDDDVIKLSYIVAKVFMKCNLTNEEGFEVLKVMEEVLIGGEK